MQASTLKDDEDLSAEEEEQMKARLRGMQQQQQPEHSVGSTTSTPQERRVVPSSMRRLTVTFTPSTPSNGTSEPMVLHVSFQGFLDALWVLVTEDTNCSPGVIITNAGMPEELRATTHFKYNNELPVMECHTHMGRRDDPLTNVLASTLAHTVRVYGEMRSLVMCLSVVDTGKRLGSPEDKRAFLALMKETLMELAKGGGEPA